MGSGARGDGLRGEGAASLPDGVTVSNQTSLLVALVELDDLLTSE